MIYDTAMKEVDPLEMDEEAQGELLSYERRNGPKVPTFRGNINLTVEDDVMWDGDKYIRICF